MTERTTRDYVATCETTGKRQYGQRRDAVATKKRMSRLAMRRSDAHRLNVYRCEHCGFWHVGNTLKAAG